GRGDGAALHRHEERDRRLHRFVAKYGWPPAWGGAANATPSGKLTKECWETIRDMIVGAARKAGKLDGICLSLHGAMVTETEDDAEGAVLELLRGVVGPEGRSG